MKLAEVSVKRPIFITCAFTVIVCIGYLSLTRLAVDLFPDINFPIITVNTTYPGAAPVEVETLISKPMEDEISTIAGIKRVSSINKEGMSTVIAEFTLKTDIKYAEQQVRDKAASARRKLPEDAKEPIIRRIDPADQPVVTIGVKANLPKAQLFDLADEIIKPNIQQVDQVGLVEILGGQKREIRVELDQNKLKDYEVSASLVAQRIGAAGENVPAGKVNRSDKELVYRTLAEFKTIEDIESTVINFFANERGVRIRDIGKVVDSLEEEKSKVYLNGEPALVLQVFRQSGSNTIAVVDSVKKKVEALKLQLANHPAKVELKVIRDNSQWIRANVTDVKESIFMGITLTVIVVLFFLGNFRSTFITGLALPNSLLGAFILMAIAGFTINIMTLLALSLSVGLLVDDAIVVRENIFRHIELGSPPRKAALEGTSEVFLAVLGTTLTVIAVFGPIGFLQGVVGQFFKEFGLTICFAMMISLVDAFTMAPMLSAYFAGKAQHGVADVSNRSFIVRVWTKIYRMTLGGALRSFERFQVWLVHRYEKIIIFTLKHPLMILLGGLSIFIFSLYCTKYLPKTFLPAQEQGEFNVNIDLPPGTSLDGTGKLAQEIDTLIRKNPEIDTVIMTVGDRDLESNKASFYVKLVPLKNRKISTSGLKDRLREQLLPYAKANPIVGDYNAVGTSERPFMLNILGNDLEKLEKVANQVYQKLKVHPALKDADISFRPGKPEYQIQIDPEKAERLGVSTKTAANELRTLVEGTVPAVFRESGREYDIRVRLKDEDRNLQDRVYQTYVPNINNRLARLSEISIQNQKTGPSAINRENRSRYVNIGADITPNGPGMGGAIQATNEIFAKDVKLDSGMSYRFVGQAENFKELMENMLMAMALGILFIYFVLSSLYESFITPFTIMLVLPLAICGAFFALLLTGKSLDLFSMIGIILLLGVATKNSILVVDYANQLLKQGMNRRDAIIAAGKIRLRPILMTSFALIAGMLPIAIGLNEASRQRTSMGVAIIGGLISSTFLTLVIVPAAFSYMDRFKNWIESGFKRLTSMEQSSGSEIQHGK